MSATEDVKEGDLLTTSGVDGVYPPGLPVARVVHVDRRSDTSFARIQCQPLARLQGVTHVMVLAPVQRQTPPVADGALPVAAAASTASSAAGAGRPASAPAGARRTGPAQRRSAAEGERR